MPYFRSCAKITAICLMLTLVSSCANFSRNIDETLFSTRSQDGPSINIKTKELKGNERIEEDSDIGEKFKSTDSIDITKQKKYGKEWQIAILLPLSGKNETFGMHVLDAVTLALFDFADMNIKIIPIDTGDSNKSAIRAAEMAISIHADAVIGPIFATTTAAVEPVLSQAGIKTISLSNSSKLLGKGVQVFGIMPEALLLATLDYAKDTGHTNFGFIFPSNNKGFAMDKTADEITKQIGALKMFSDYYQSNQDFYVTVAKKVASNYKVTYKQNEKGELFLESVRDKLNKKNKTEKAENIKSVVKQLDAVYVDASGVNLFKMMAEFGKIGLLSKNILFLSNENVDDDVLKTNHYAEGMVFAGTTSDNIAEFERHFKQQFGYKPVKIATLAYDATTTLIFLMQKYGLSDEAFYNTTGFSGVYGDFKFTKSGLVQRKFNIYEIRKGNPILIDQSLLFM